MTESARPIQDYAPTWRVPALRPPREKLWPAFGFLSHLLVMLALALVVAATYANSFKSGMTLDNKYIIEEYYRTLAGQDPLLDFRSWRQVGLIFGNDYWSPKGISGLYRPITTLSYWLDYVVFNYKAPKHDRDFQPMKAPDGSVMTADKYKAMTWKEYTSAPGLLPTGSYHVINLTVHWLNAALLYFCSLVLLKRFWPAAFVAALFAAHPIATESVTNIIGRADLFAGATVFGGLLLYMRSTVARPGWRLAPLSRWIIVLIISLALIVTFAVIGTLYPWWRAGLILLAIFIPPLACIHDRAPWLLLLALLTAFGLFAKESSVAVGVVIPLYWLVYRFEWRKQDWWQRLWPELLVWCVMLPPLIGMLGVRHWVFANSSPAEEPFLDNPIRGIWQVRALHLPSFEQQLAERPLLGVSYIECKMTAVKVMGRLIGLLAWPQTLCSDYSYSEIPNFSWHLARWADWQAIVSLVFLIAVGWLTVRLWKSGKRSAFFYICFFTIAALPTANIFYTIGSIMAERFMYVPLAGFVGVLVLGTFALAEWLSRRLQPTNKNNSALATWIATAALGIICTAYSVRAALRNPVWRDDEALWTDAIVHSPRAFRCYQSLAFALFERDAIKNVDQMIHIAEGGLPIVDGLPDHLNSARLYLHLGMYYSIKGDTLLQKRSPGDNAMPAEALVYYKKAVAILRRGSQVDRAFDEVNKTKQRLRGDSPAGITDAGLGPVYGTLALCCTRIGDFQGAFNALSYERQLDPTDIDSYVKQAAIEIEQGKLDDAATTVIQGILIDANRRELWNTLIQLYQKFGQRGADAIVIQGNQPKLNVNNALLREQMLNAYRRFVRDFRRAHREALAEDTRKTAVERYGYPASLFDPLFTEPVQVCTPEGIQAEEFDTSIPPRSFP